MENNILTKDLNTCYTMVKVSNMKELKTLKDFKATEWNSEHTKKFEDWVKISELKAEAIKWIKLIEKDCPDRYEHYLGEIYGLVNWIKDFFNIKEEELAK